MTKANEYGYPPDVEQSINEMAIRAAKPFRPGSTIVEDIKPEKIKAIIHLSCLLDKVLNLDPIDIARDLIALTI